jgi:hypothetical protein
MGAIWVNLLTYATIRKIGEFLFCS